MKLVRFAAALALAVAAALTGCQDSAGPLSPPAPVITAITPDSALLGSDSLVIRVSGRSFHAETLVRLNGTGVSTRFIDTAELEATVPASMLSSAVAIEITAFTPAPGGGASEPQLLRVVRAATPSLSGLSPESAVYGSDGFVLTVTGTNFYPVSVVRWNGLPLATTYVSATVLRADVAASRLLVQGVAEVTVSTPIGGGGTSEPLAFLVIPAHPVITVLPSRGAAAGRPGFTLTLHGEHFGQGSAVRWNGQLRDATFLAPDRLAVAVSSADVAAPASVELSVVNVGGRESQPVTFRIRALGPATGTVHRVPLSARDLVWNPGTGLLYVSVGAGLLANTITAVDPNTGEVEKSAFIGNEPNRLARSDDGQILYVGLDGANAIRRLALATFTPGLQWSLPDGQVAGDIEVVPGQPHAVAVSRNRTDAMPPLDGVTIYDGGVPRAASSPGHTGASRIEFLESPDELYGYDDYSSEFAFYTLAVNTNGVHLVRRAVGLLSGYSTEIVGAAGRIYSSNGAVLDAGRSVRVGTAGSGHGVAADPETGRLFYVTTSGVDVHDMNTFQHLGTIDIMDLTYDATTRVVRWGEDGLAFLTQDELVIVRSPIVRR